MIIVKIVGVGALGSHVAQFMRSMDCELSVIDFDRVEQKNVLSQFHAKSHVGKSKVESLTKTMHFLFGQRIDGKPVKLTKDNVDVLLSRTTTDLIIDCLDNAEGRTLVQTFAKQHQIPCLHGALAANGEFGRVVWTENFTIDQESGAGATCEDGQHLPFIVMTASFIAFAALQFLSKQSKKVGFSVSAAGALRI